MSLPMNDPEHRAHSAHAVWVNMGSRIMSAVARKSERTASNDSSFHAKWNSQEAALNNTRRYWHMDNRAMLPCKKAHDAAII